MSAINYRIEAIKAFELLDKALRRFVEDEMRAKYGIEWLQSLRSNIRYDRDDQPIWDTLALECISKQGPKNEPLRSR